MEHTVFKTLDMINSYTKSNKSCIIDTMNITHIRMRKHFRVSGFVSFHTSVNPKSRSLAEVEEVMFFTYLGLFMAMDTLL